MHNEVLSDKLVVYQFCGAGDMYGGVQDAANVTAGYMRDVEGMRTGIFIGSADSEHKTHEVFDQLDNNIVILGGKNRNTVANGSQNSIGGFVSRRVVGGLLDISEPDIVHIMAPWKPYIGGMTLRAAHVREIPTVATYHIHSDSHSTNSFVRAAGFVDKKVIRNLDAMIAVSDPAEQHLRENYKFDGQVHQIPNGVDVATYEQANSFEKDEPFEGYDPINRKTIVFVGRPDERKGLGELLSATSELSLISGEDFDFQLIVCGDGPNLDIYKDQAINLELEDKVRFVGNVSNSNKMRWLASADLAAFPAKYGESQGIVLLEAMAAGAKAVIGGNNLGYSSVLNDLDCADLAIVSPIQTTAFAAQMLTLLSDETLAIDLFQQQQRLVREKYDIKVTGHQIADVYRTVIKKNRQKCR